MDNFRFRGKTRKGEWVEGYLCFDYEWYGGDKQKDLLIQDEKDLHHNIIPESLAINTGIKDQKGKEIFSSIPLENGKMSRGGDTIKDLEEERNGWIYWSVRWNHKSCSFDLYSESDFRRRLTFTIKNKIEIIGNQFDGLEKE